MLDESVRNMVKRSMPRPQPPVGGRPYSRALQKVSSISCASSSPAALSCARVAVAAPRHFNVLSAAQASPATRLAWREQRTLAWSANRSRWVKGLFSSVYELHSSFWHTKSSKRSVRPGVLRWLQAMPN